MADILETIAPTRICLQTCHARATSVLAAAQNEAKRRPGSKLLKVGLRVGEWSASGHLVAAFQDALSRYEISKGTIRFPLSEPVPVKLIERIAKFRAKEGARVSEQHLR